MAEINFTVSIDAQSNCPDIYLAALVAHWTMDDVTGSTLEEEFDNHDGTLINTPVQDSDSKKGVYSMLFDDASLGKITVPDHDTFSLHATEARTLAFWFKAPDTGAFHMLFQKGTGYSADGEWNIYHYQDRLYGAVLRSTDGYDMHRYRSGAVLTDNTWHHGVITFMTNKKWNDGGNIKVWVDKVEQAAFHGGTTTGVIANTASLFQMGFGKSQYWSTGDNYYDGRIDDVRWYEGELSQGFIDALYDSGEVFFTGAINVISNTSEANLTGGSAGVFVTDDIAFDDTMDCNVEREPEALDHTLVFNALIDAFLPQDELTEAIGLHAEFDAGFEIDETLAETLALNDAMDALNWTQWYRENRGKANMQFVFTLTGAPDATTDIELPIKSFNARKRTDNPTYLSLVVPSYNFLQQITDRANGELVIDAIYIINDQEAFRTELVRVVLDKIRPDEGSINRSISLSGYKTTTFLTQLVTLPRENSTYRSIQDGKIVHRFADIDPFVNPGDNCVVGTDTFRIGSVNYNLTDLYSTMELREV